LRDGGVTGQTVFFEKRTKKLLLLQAHPGDRAATANKSFLLLFSKKKFFLYHQLQVTMPLKNRLRRSAFYEHNRLTIALATLTFLAHVAGNPHYGFFRDELYFIVCGRHPAFGYVDQPPLIPLLAAASQFFGTSLLAVRTVPAALAAATVYSVCLLVRDMGGGRFAALVAALSTALAPVLLAFGTMLGPDSIQMWLWPLAILFTARALMRSPAWWLAAGAAFGVAAEGKYSAIIAAFALLMALAITDRRVFTSARFWQGMLIASALVLPNALWQWHHGFPMLELLQNGQHGKNVLLTPVSFLLQQVLLTNPLLALAWLVGLAWCLFSPRWRWLGVMFCALLAIMILLHGKAYYPAPIYPALFAAGGVAIEHFLAKRRLAQIATVSACLVAGLALAPLTLPVFPEPQMIFYLGWLKKIGIGIPAMEHKKPAVLGQIFADMHGWQDLAQNIQSLRAGLPAAIRAQTFVFASNYGEAAAIDVLSTDPTMPPTLSGHNQYWLWGPRDWNGASLIDVGGNLADDQALCQSAKLLEEFHAPYIMPYEDGMDIILCTGLRVPVPELWPKLKNYN